MFQDDKLPIPYINDMKIKSNEKINEGPKKPMTTPTQDDGCTNSERGDDETLRSNKCRVVVPTPHANGSDEDSEKSTKPNENQTR